MTARGVVRLQGVYEGRSRSSRGAAVGSASRTALEIAQQGAMVVVNDVDASRDGEGMSLANTDGIRDFSAGRFDLPVSKAGFVRCRMLATMSFDEWDAVIRVHLGRRHSPRRHVAGHWRGRLWDGEQGDAKIISTSSGAGLFGREGLNPWTGDRSGRGDGSVRRRS